MKKKFTAFILILALLCALLPQTVLFASAETLSGSCGDNLIWYFDEATGGLSIVGTGAMWDYELKYFTDIFYDYTYSTAPWGKYIINSVTISSGVTHIGNYAFYNYIEWDHYVSMQFVSITIPGSVTSIGYDAFSGCSSLTAVHISDLEAWCNIDFGTSDSNPLYYAHNLYLNDELVTDLVIPDSVTSIGRYAFYDCSSLTSVAIPNSVTSIDAGTFEGCTGLTEISIPNSVTSIGREAFSGCNQIKSILFLGDAPSLGYGAFSGVTATALYYDSASWKSAVTSTYGGNITWVPSIGSLTDFLEYTIDLTTVGLTISGPDAIPAQETLPWYRIPNLITSLALKDGITEISASAFSNMTAIKSATIPASVGKVMNNAFSGCTALESVVILNPNCVIGGATETLGVPGFTVVYGYPGSTAESWAASHGYTFKPIGDCAGGKHTYSCTQIAPTCTKTGTKTYTCIFCGNAYTETVPMLGHSFVDGVCSRCHAVDYTEGYTDTPASNNWAYAGINFAIERDLMGSTSTSEQTFEPNTKLSRAMVASILYRLCDSPAVTYQGTFTDVKNNQWFTSAIEWAAQDGLAAGKGDGTFDPNGNVTRQELAVFMKKTAEYLEKNTSGRNELSSFADSASVPSWAREYVQWAVDAGLISGKASGGKTLLAPTDTATRAEFASIIMRFVQNIAEAG